MTAIWPQIELTREQIPGVRMVASLTGYDPQQAAIFLMSLALREYLTDEKIEEAHTKEREHLRKYLGRRDDG